MPAVHVRALPLDVVESLKRRAARHERSLEGELRSILTAVARQEDTALYRAPLDLRFSSAKPRGSWSREEIYGDDGR